MLTFTFEKYSIKGNPGRDSNLQHLTFCEMHCKYSQKVAILRNLHQVALNSASLRIKSASLRIKSASLRIKSASLRIEALSLLSIYTKRKTRKNAAWNSKLTYLT